MRSCVFPVLALALLLSLPYSARAQETARGIVYKDANQNLHRDADESGIGGVPVSNGREVVLSDPDGAYALPVDGDAVIFVIKPANYATPVSERMLPTFYYVHRPNGSPPQHFPGAAPTGPLPGSIDFPLWASPEPGRFQVLMFGDTQPRDRREVEFLAHDVFESLIGYDAAFGMTLGDVVFNDLDVFNPLADAMAWMGMPWYNVPGNHDTNQDAPGDVQSMETFTSIFGPPYYSFNYGAVHFVVLDDIAWEGKSYHGELGVQQLEFLKNDLALVPEDKLVVLTMHIPLVALKDKEAVYRLIEERPFSFSISAHTHTQENVFVGPEDGWHGAKPHHHLIHGTACGSWMGGTLDERGIPHATMSDGTPNGYSFITFDGVNYSVEYRAASRPAGYQMNIYTPESVATADLANTEAVTNIFAGSERSITKMRVDNRSWMPMEQVFRPDPALLRMKALEPLLPEEAGRKLPNPKTEVTHLWAAKLHAGLAPGAHLIEIETTDIYGMTYNAYRMFRVEE